MTRLDEFDFVEWRDVARAVAPHVSDEEFEVMWADFFAEKEARERAKALQ